jgi:acyl-coenzyme A thioesterase 9
VRASVVEAETGVQTTTNNFRLTWCRDSGPPLQRKVVPQTYRGGYLFPEMKKTQLMKVADAMLWLEAKRNLEMGAELRGLRKT